MSEETQSFESYLNAVDAELTRIYGITVMDAGIEFDEIAGAQEAGETPAEYVQWFGEKYDLTPKTELHAAGVIHEG